MDRGGGILGSKFIAYLNQASLLLMVAGISFVVHEAYVIDQEISDLKASVPIRFANLEGRISEQQNHIDRIEEWVFNEKRTN